MKYPISISLAVLTIAVVTLGYLYYEETKNDVNIKLKAPNISIEKN